MVGKKKCYNNNYFFFINRNGIIIYNPRNTYDDRLLGKCKLYNGIGIKPIYNIILKTHIWESNCILVMTCYNHTNLTLYGIWRLPTKYDRRTWWIQHKILAELHYWSFKSKMSIVGT